MFVNITTCYNFAKDLKHTYSLYYTKVNKSKCKMQIPICIFLKK